MKSKKDRKSWNIPLLLNAEVDTLCNGVEAVGQLEKTVNEGACTSLNASFLLWLLMLSISLEGCHANCKGCQNSEVKSRSKYQFEKIIATEKCK